MPTALVISHTSSEHPGTLLTWLPAAGLDLVEVKPWQGETLPATVQHDALIVLGGPQQAYDDASAPWLRATKSLLRQAVSDDVPTLGICLGGQLLAEATGGRVEVGADGPELGARLVAKRDAAADDELFGLLPFTPTVIQWHWDAIVELPPGAVLLAGSPRYPHQAFRVGRRAWGLQFHVEPPPEMLRTWAKECANEVLAAGLDPDAVLERALLQLDEVEAVWRPVMERFASLSGAVTVPSQ